MPINKIMAVLLTLLLTASAGGFQASMMEKVLPGRWMLYAGGGAEIWDFHADGTCVSTSYTGSSETHTWHVEAATEEDLKILWAQPKMILVIDETARYGLHLDWDQVDATLAILGGGLITEEEKALTSPLPLCISITFNEGGGGYVRMKDE